MKYAVEVTQDDIDAGERLSSRSCPLAIALSRVSGVRCGIAGGRWWSDYGFGPLPPVAQDFYWQFDAGETVHPLSFDIDDEIAPPSPSQAAPSTESK